MLRTIADWVLAFVDLVREVQNQRGELREHEKRIRDLEESLHLLLQELRHSRESELHEREKLVLRVENLLAKHSARGIED